jgi:hypothetical protein
MKAPVEHPPQVVRRFDCSQRVLTDHCHSPAHRASRCCHFHSLATSPAHEAGANIVKSENGDAGKSLAVTSDSDFSRFQEDTPLWHLQTERYERCCSFPF